MLWVEPLVVEHDIQDDFVHVFELLFGIINAVWMDSVAIVLNVVMDVVAGCQHSLKPLVIGIYALTIEFKGIFIVPVKA